MRCRFYAIALRGVYTLTCDRFVLEGLSTNKPKTRRTFFCYWFTVCIDVLTFLIQLVFFLFVFGRRKRQRRTCGSQIWGRLCEFNASPYSGHFGDGIFRQAYLLWALHRGTLTETLYGHRWHRMSVPCVEITRERRGE